MFVLHRTIRNADVTNKLGTSLANFHHTLVWFGAEIDAPFDKLRQV